MAAVVPSHRQYEQEGSTARQLRAGLPVIAHIAGERRNQCQ